MSTETYTPAPDAASTARTTSTPRVRVPIPPPDSADDILTCATCGAANAGDSRFCRKCGDALVTAAPATSNPSAPNGAAVKPVSTLGDETRARHLLDRAFALAERGDRAGAILACRQSVALAPIVPQGFSMLGLLLERNGDLQGAANAYTRVLHLAPGSRLEEESLARLRATMEATSSVSARRKNVPTFDFNDDDLAAVPAAIPDASPTTSPDNLDTTVVTTTAPAVAATAIAATAVAATATAAVADTNKHGTRVLPPNVPSAPANVSAIVAPVQTVPTKATIASAQIAPAQIAPFPTSLAVPAVAALDFDVVDDTPVPLWRQIAARPNFYWSGLPLAGAALLGLLVMSWGRSSALSRQVVDPVTTATSEEVMRNPSASAVNNASNNANPGVPDYSVKTPPSAVGGAGLNDSAPFGSAPLTPANGAPATQNNAPANGAPATQNNVPANTNNNRRANNGVRRVPERASSFPQPAFPSPATPSIAPAMPSLLPPVRSVPSTQPGSGSVSVTPSYGQSNNNIASSGGAPFGANRPKNSGSITLSPRRSPDAAAPRPSNSARNSERAAANASNAGRGNDAIDSINSALQSGGDTGWRYQQRALLFLERGDNQRAADDFQTAIAAYRDQINRGERSSEAKAGIQACQSGLRLALANAR